MTSWATEPERVEDGGGAETPPSPESNGEWGTSDFQPLIPCAQTLPSSQGPGLCSCQLIRAVKLAQPEN